MSCTYLTCGTATCRATADSDEGVPLGGLAKLGSNVADLMTNLEASKLQRPSANMYRLAGMLGGNAGQLLTPASTNPKTSPESPPADSSETTVSPAEVQLSVSPIRRGGSPLQKGRSLAALMDIAESEASVTSSTAGLLPATSNSPKAVDRYPFPADLYPSYALPGLACNAARISVLSAQGSMQQCANSLCASHALAASFSRLLHVCEILSGKFELAAQSGLRSGHLLTGVLVTC